MRWVASLARGLVVLLALVMCPAATALTWSAPVAVSTRGDHHLQSAVADSSGDAMVVWNTLVDSTHVPVEDVRSFAWGGFGATETLTRPETSGIFAAAAMDDRRDAGVVWYAGGSAFGVEGLLYDRGAASGTRFSLGTPQADCTATEADIKFDARGDASVFWLDCTHVWVVDRPAGGAFGSARAVPAAGSTRINAVDYGVGGDGTTVVVWTDYHGVYATTRDPGGDFRSVTLTSNSDSAALRPEPTLDGGLGQPDVAVDAHGDAVASWIESVNGNSAEYVMAAYKPAGGSWLAPVRLAQVHDLSPFAPATIDDSGTATVAWDDGFSDKVLAATGRDQSFGAPEVVADHAGCGENAATDARGVTYIAWQRYDMPCSGSYNAHSGHIEVAERPPGGHFTGAFDSVGNGAEWIAGPWLAPQGDGGMLVAWQDGATAHDSQVYVAQTRTGAQPAAPLDPGASTPTPGAHDQPAVGAGSTQTTRSSTSRRVTLLGAALTLPARTVSLRRLRRRGLIVAASCRRRCTLTATLAHARHRLARRTATLAPRHHTVLRLRPHIHRPQRLTLSVQIAAGGHHRTITRIVDVRR